MSNTKPSPHQVALAGRHLVAAELLRRGASHVTLDTEVRGVDLLASSRDRAWTVGIKVKTKRTGNWQATIGRWPSRQPGSPDAYFWVFVDLGEEPGMKPSFFIIPERWIQEDIDRAHREYLEAHGGSRPQSPSSKHHSIEPQRIERWRDRWDLIQVIN